LASPNDKTAACAADDVINGYYGKCGRVEHQSFSTTRFFTRTGATSLETL